MNIFNIISLFGGLAMFLYGMRLMGNSLKEGSSGTLKVIMERVTDNHIKAFFLGLFVTALIQSSTATIVITSGLVAAGIITIDQSLGIIVGANVGTTVTGQIIRLLDVNADSGSLLQFFQPSTLAPLALIFGITCIMFFKFKRSDNIGNISIGFGILFSGLLNMTSSVSELQSSGVFSTLFENLGNNPILGYLVGLLVAFILQSSSASIGILQAFSMSGYIPFKTIYVVLVGIYLGDCVTTALVCSIGAKADARRVGIINILFNLSKTVLVILGVTIAHNFGLLDNLWNEAMTSGTIANTNSIFNLVCALVLLPCVKIFSSISYKIIKNGDDKNNKYADKISALNPVFYSTPAIAFGSCYDVLITMFEDSTEMIKSAISIVSHFDESIFKKINDSEEDVDHLTDCLDNYLVDLSPHVSEDNHTRILTQYHKLVSEFEHLGDYAVYIAKASKEKAEENIDFSEQAMQELELASDLLNKMLEHTRNCFVKLDVKSANHIEPLAEVMNELTSTLHDNHLERLRDGCCTIRAGVLFSEIISNFNRISDTCSNVGMATVSRVYPKTTLHAHSYLSALRGGENSQFNEEYTKAYDTYITELEARKNK